MFRRLLTFAVRSYVRGPARSWIFTSGAMLLWRAVTRAGGKKEIIDLSRTKPGDRYVIEHLDITHKQQIKDLKRSRRADKLSNKQVSNKQQSGRG